ncbi:MAG: nitrogenase component 1 [Clostridiaceae bacterium]|nr:nitrogenase component 1 [Clostridiaceae bacterium]
MLKRVGETVSTRVAVREASFPSPFASTLEYAAPARGMWNIVHTGMLIPEAHQIFVCAAGCLRGVVLTAAEMGAQERFSTIAVRENNVRDGDMEELILDGVGDILSKLAKRPPAILLYTSCIHHFMSCDLARVYSELRERYPDVAFTDCYMNPIMRKSGLTPDQLMRARLYSLLLPRPLDENTVAILGNDLPTDETSELYGILRRAGKTVRDITACRTYGEYQEMAAASLYITTYPSAKSGGEQLSRRLGGRHLYLPMCFISAEIEDNLHRLEDAMGLPPADYAAAKAASDTALDETAVLLGNTPVAIDYTAHPRPLGLAKLLLEHGIAVREVYIDTIAEEERPAFDWLRAHAPVLALRPTVAPAMRVAPRAASETLAVGQKAAYFTGTDRFVNIVEGGGLYGFDGITRLAALIADAFKTPKDTRSLIQIKGFGCGGGCAL